MIYSIGFLGAKLDGNALHTQLSQLVYFRKYGIF